MQKGGGYASTFMNKGLLYKIFRKYQGTGRYFEDMKSFSSSYPEKGTLGEKLEQIEKKYKEKNQKETNLNKKKKINKEKEEEIKNFFSSLKNFVICYKKINKYILGNKNKKTIYKKQVEDFSSQINENKIKDIENFLKKYNISTEWERSTFISKTLQYILYFSEILYLIFIFFCYISYGLWLPDILIPLISAVISQGQGFVPPPFLTSIIGSTLIFNSAAASINNFKLSNQKGGKNIENFITEEEGKITEQELQEFKNKLKNLSKEEIYDNIKKIKDIKKINIESAITIYGFPKIIQKIIKKMKKKK